MIIPGDQITEFQALSAALALLVHVIPSGLVITLSPVPLCDTAANNDNSGDQVTEFQLLSAALALLVHVIPSGLVITLSPVPVFATAANNDNSR